MPDEVTIEQVQAELKSAQDTIASLTAERDLSVKELDELRPQIESLSTANRDFATKLEESTKALTGLESLQTAHDELKIDRDNIAGQLETERGAKAELETRMLDFRRQSLLTRFKLADETAERVKTMTDDQLSVLETTLPGLNLGEITSHGTDLGNSGGRNVGDLTPYEATQRMIEKAKANHA